MSVARWPDIRDAVKAAIVAAAQLGPDRVIWKYQNYGAPALDYCTLAFTGVRKIGQDFLEQSYDATRAPGQEIALVVRGNREVTLEVECFTASTVPGQDPAAPPAVPGMDGLGRASLIATSLLLPRVRDAMGAVGVVPFDDGAVQNIPDVVSAGFRGRAVLPIRCYAPAQAIADYFTWIASVSVGLNAGGRVSTVKAP